MQLKGLVRFFTILLILYSVYELSFTWVVRSHEKKQAAKAQQFVNTNLATADAATKKRVQDSLYDKFLNDTKDETVHYGFSGAISYDKAKREELNLGLDLKGGINVSLDVDLSGMVRSLANNPTDINLNKAIENANTRRLNDDGNYIDIFVEEYKKLVPNGRLATVFAGAAGESIKAGDTDDQVTSALKQATSGAFDNTFEVLKKRIDQFGVAQPNISKDEERDIITVELPGLQNVDRVRQTLQSSANLQFWLTYKTNELLPYWQAADEAYAEYRASKAVGADTSLADSTGAFSLLKDFPTLAQTGFSEIATKDTALFRDVINNVLVNAFPPDARFYFGLPNSEGSNKNSSMALYVIKTNGLEKAPLEGEVVTDAVQVFDQVKGTPAVSMDMNFTGAQKWEELTGASVAQQIPIAIILDDIVYSAPVANQKIAGGKTQISGNFTVEEAKDLATILKSGRLSAPPRIVQMQEVGATLGEAAIKGGFMAFVISFAVIFLLMLVYYNTSGWVANIALILNLLFTIGVLTGLGATLTAPGIAGLVLTIGMAVDTNVIIYERIKEELSNGKSYQAAVNEGYKRSLPPVLDAHITTLLTAIILFSFGLGPVKGFATTQIIGIILSLFCGILVSRWVTEWFTSKKRHLEYFTPVSRRIFKHAKYKFIEYRKVAYIISGLVLLAGIGAIFNGFDKGVEFSGGRSYVVNFGKNISSSVEPIRESLTKQFGEAPIIKTIGGADQLDITTAYMAETTSDAADAQVESKLLAGLQSYGDARIVGRTNVSPTISETLRDDAKWATFWSLMIIALYIFIRFRDWRYSLGTIVALLHDVLVTLAVFSFFRDIVPFPLELDQHFIAAVLTVIGFSMNDTVIVFDRIREMSRKMPGASKTTIINGAINDTLSRTIMTSLTVFLTLLILFIFGGDVTRGFAFAMLIGVLTGTYSSIFVAAPILVDLGGKKALGSEPKVAETAKPKPVVERQ